MEEFSFWNVIETFYHVEKHLVSADVVAPRSLL